MVTAGPIRIRHPFARRLNCTHAVTNYHCKASKAGVVSELSCAQCGEVLQQLVWHAPRKPWVRSYYT